MRPMQDETAADLSDHKQAALGYVAQAFAEAELDGLDGDFVVQAALFEAFRHLVELYGEEQTATYAESIPARIREGSYTVCARH
jgi:predicted HD phosphohydrolase